YLNTLAQAGGLSQLDIAKWSGRVNVSQNRAYDHQSDRDVLALVRQAVGGEQHSTGDLARLHKSMLIPRDEFARLKVPTAHTTEFGYCIHDFTMLPCQLHQDCLNCDEQICIKGDAVREANLRRHRDETRMLLAAAEAAVAEESAGADRWSEHQRKTLERLDQLCGILEDPRVPFGTVIQLRASNRLLSGVISCSERRRVAQGSEGYRRRWTRAMGRRRSDSRPSEES
ncbi:MAG: integrase, partial [Pseudomonadales bacterium]